MEVGRLVVFGGAGLCGAGRDWGLRSRGWLNFWFYGVWVGGVSVEGVCGARGEAEV